MIKSDPNWEALPDATPARLRQVVRRCLQKDPKQRVHDVGDLRLAMEGAFETIVTERVEAAAARTLQVWQPRTARRLSREDARQIVENVTGFVQILLEWDAAAQSAPNVCRTDVSNAGSPGTVRSIE